MRLAGVSSVSAQAGERLEISAIVRPDRVSFEGRQNVRLPVTGVAAAYRVWGDMRVEGEVTMASGESRRSYEGGFHVVRGTRGDTRGAPAHGGYLKTYDDQQGGTWFATAVAVETREPGRVNRSLRAGTSLRQYDYIDDMVVLRVPDGVTFDEAEAAMPDGRGERSRSGLLDWRDCAGAHYRAPPRCTRSAMGVGRSGPDW